MHTPDEYIEIASLAPAASSCGSVLVQALLREYPQPMTAAPHPLDPLERRRARARRRLRARARASSAAPCASSASSCASRTRPQLAAWRGGRRAAAARGGARRARGRAAPTRRSSRSTASALVAWEHVPGAHAAITADEYAEAEVAVKADPGLPRGARAARRRRSRARHGRHLVGRPASRSPAAASGARSSGCAAISRATTATRGRSAACSRSSTSTRMQVVRIDDHGVAAGARGARRLPRRRRPAVPRRSAADRGRAARGLEPRAGRPRAQLGALAPAHRLQPARVADAARARVRRGRRRGPAADRAPALDRRARDPVRRHESDRRLQERVRHRRVRPRPVRQLARARLRLPRRDPLPRRRRARQPGARADDRERHLPARGGHGHPLEALRLAQRRDRRAPRAAARDLDDRRRSATTSTGSTGTSRSTAAIAFEAKLTGVLHTAGVAAGRAARRRPRSSRPASARATTSTSSARASTSTSTASATSLIEVDSRARPAGPGEPARPVVHACARRRSRASSRRSA